MGLPLRDPRPATGLPAFSSHLELLRIADVVQQAALARDEEVLHRSLCRLRSAVVGHLQGEGPGHAALPISTRAVVCGGQRRLLDLVDQLLGSSADGHDGCPCVVRAAELHGALRAQARLETNALSR